MLTVRHFLVVRFPLGLIDLGFGEALPDHFFHAHARARIPALLCCRLHRPLRGIALPLRILAQGKLDARRAPRTHFLRRFAPTQLYDDRLSADGIGAAMQHVGNCQPARQSAIDIDICRVHHVFDVHH